MDTNPKTDSDALTLEEVKKIYPGIFKRRNAISFPDKESLNTNNKDTRKIENQNIKSTNT